MVVVARRKLAHLTLSRFLLIFLGNKGAPELYFYFGNVQYDCA